MSHYPPDEIAWPLLFVIPATGLALLYLTFVGIGFAVLQLWPKRAAARRISPVPVTRAQLQRELLFSLSTILIFAATIAGVLFASQQWGWFRIYQNAGEYGATWLVLSLPATVLIQDFYFYWTHRFMHLPGIYERVHRIHHLSANPTPLAGFSFHPLEALIQAFSIVVIVILIPVHPAMVALFLFYVMATNAMGHLGHEMLPVGLARSAWLGWLNTATGHSQHHRTHRYNFGLYTMIWDRLFGTAHPQYERLYDRVTTETPLPIEDKPDLVRLKTKDI